jgi:serine/threonine protein kinase
VAFRNRAVDEPRLRDAFVQLSRGVAAVHAAGRLHCDIKPSNVLVDENARIVLADFGLTSAYGAVVRPGSGQRLMGTPVYMSPEHVAGASSLGPASDWYAVGVMLYEALSGIVPFGGADSSVLSMKGSAVPALPSTFNPSVPADLEALAMDLLAIDPADRPGAEEVLERLGGSGRSRSRSRLTAGESPPQVPFVGRTFELAQLRKASRELDAPTLVLVTGRSGMGKTRLLDEFLREEAARGSLVLRGRCYQRESVPYKGVDAVVDELAAFLMTRPEREVAAWDLPTYPR